jgi:hypothetical protein
MQLCKISILISLFILAPLHSNEPRSFPFYEDYLKDSDFRGFLKTAKEFLEKHPDAPEAPRLAYDFMMVGKAASDVESVKFATNLLLFKHTKSLPSLNFISSFDRGSPRLIELLKAKAEEGDLASKEFAAAYCRAILFIARAQGPELLKDRSLRLRTHLLAQKAGVNEVLSVSAESLNKLSQEDSSFGKITKIALDESLPLEKVKAMSSLSGRDADFCKSFFLAQLDEKEANSESMVLFKIEQAVFSKNPNPQEGIKLIDTLPSQKRKESKIRFTEAVCLHFDDRKDEAIKLLESMINQKGTSKEWKETAKAYAQGLEFLENRKSVLAEAVGKAVSNLKSDTDALFFSAKFQTEKKDVYEIYLGTSQKDKHFEIQLHRGGKIIVGYRTVEEKSSILQPDSEKILSFESIGALPVPKFGITREVETGTFNYSFNLNFSSSFDEFVEEGSKITENAYLATSKGREVLITHILKTKPMWLGPAQTISGGTSFPISLYSNDEDQVSQGSLSFDLSGNFKTVNFGSFSINQIKFGDKEILRSLPAWPKLPSENKEKFDFPLFMKILGEATQGFQ